MTIRLRPAVRSLYLALLCAVLVSGCSLFCEDVPMEGTVSCIDAEAFALTDLAELADRNPAGEKTLTVKLIIPGEKSRMVWVKGNDPLYQILSINGVLEGAADRHWGQVAVIRPFPRALKRSPGRDVFVILVDCKKLLNRDVLQNITVLPYDTIIVPNSDQRVKAFMESDLGRRVRYLSAKELDLEAVDPQVSAPAKTNSISIGG